MRNTRLHLLHMLTGILIATLLGIHLVTLHLNTIFGFFGVDAVSWEEMISRARQGIWAGLYIALLAVVLYHALYGLRGIILETTPSARTERIVTPVFIIIGIIVFIWGSYVPIALLSS
ncbi:hypothetical protein ACFLYE_03375 [Chloroflexota bacterium]